MGGFLSKIFRRKSSSNESKDEDNTTPKTEEGKQNTSETTHESVNIPSEQPPGNSNDPDVPNNKTFEEKVAITEPENHLTSNGNFLKSKNYGNSQTRQPLNKFDKEFLKPIGNWDRIEKAVHSALDRKVIKSAVMKSLGNEEGKEERFGDNGKNKYKVDKFEEKTAPKNDNLIIKISIPNPLKSIKNALSKLSYHNLSRLWKNFKMRTSKENAEPKRSFNEFIKDTMPVEIFNTNDIVKFPERAFASKGDLAGKVLLDSSRASSREFQVDKYPPTFVTLFSKSAKLEMKKRMDSLTEKAKGRTIDGGRAVIYENNCLGNIAGRILPHKKKET